MGADHGRADWLEFTSTHPDTARRIARVGDALAIQTRAYALRDLPEPLAQPGDDCD